MYKFIRWYNQNRTEAIIIFTIIAFALIIIYTLNGILEKQNEQKKNEISFGNSSTSQGTTISKANKSVITGEKVPAEIGNKYENTIKQFIENCNNNKTLDAYNMLTDECKEQLYPSLGEFIKNYHTKIFNIKRIYTLENWYKEVNSCTYFITYKEDVLSTGDVNSKNNKSDYITVVLKDDGFRLNIGSYVGRNLYTQKAQKDNILIQVNWEDIYIDFCILNITIKNNTKKTICLDTKEKSGTTFIYDENNVKYNSFLNEIAEEELKFDKNQVRTLNIKFNKMYNPERTIQGIVFQDIVLNYELYKEYLEKKDRIMINT